MCNIIAKQCIVCGKYLPLHLGDFDTDPDEVEMFCENHIPEKDVRIFLLLEDDVWDDYPEDFIDTRKPVVIHPKGTKFAIRALTDNARAYKDKNFPNVASDWTEIELNEKGVEVPIIKRTRADVEEEMEEIIIRIREREKQ